MGGAFLFLALLMVEWLRWRDGGFATRFVCLLADSCAICAGVENRGNLGVGEIKKVQVVWQRRGDPVSEALRP